MLKINWRTLLSFLLILALLALGLIYRGFVLAYLVEPFARIVWLVWRVFLSIDQGVYWICLIFAAFYLGLRILPTRAEEFHQAVQAGRLQTDNRVEYWHSLMRLARTQPDAQQLLRQQLDQLGASVKALSGRNGASETGEALEPERSPFDVGIARSKSNLQKLLTLIRESRLKSMIRKWVGRSKHEQEESTDQILRTMESMLEIQDDRPSNDLYHR